MRSRTYGRPPRRPRGSVHVPYELVEGFRADKLGHARGLAPLRRVGGEGEQGGGEDGARPGEVAQVVRGSVQAGRSGLQDSQGVGAHALERRAREGDKLADMIEQRLSGIETQIALVRKHLPDILQQQRNRLEEKLAELKEQLDEQRLEQEMMIIANRTDVDEEIDRLEAHVSEIRRVLGDSESIGRRLDFLMQELNREANTLGSKSTALSTTNTSVDFKVLIEQMREQIQNNE